MLYAFILDMYNKNHESNYNSRRERQKRHKEDEFFELDFLDKIDKTSPEMKNLTKMERQLFDEIETPYFDHVVKSVERKSQQVKKIRLIHEMQKLRVKASKHSFSQMEKFNQ